MIDQSHNVTDPIESLIRSAGEIRRAYAQALLVDRDALEALLEAYFGELRAANERALELMLFMSDFREAMWGVIQGAMSELDFDFGPTPPSTSSAWR